MTQRRTHERRRDATEGVWMLKLAILTGSAALYATLLDQVAASIVLYVAALTAIGVFMRKWGRPFFRSYIKPWARLPEHMDKMEKGHTEQAAGLAEIQRQQGRMTAEIAAVKAKVDHVEKANVRIERGAELAAERASAAINVAEAVRRQLGVAARGDGPDDEQH